MSILHISAEPPRTEEISMLTESQRAKMAEYTAAVSADTAAKKRLAALFDDGIYTEIDAYAKCNDDLTGVAAAYGFVNGTPVYAFSQDSSVKSGAVSKAHAAKIAKVFDLASRNGVPVVGIYDSCGAFIEDGAEAMNAYGEILAHTANLSGVVPQIAVIAGVCSGSAAVIAASADFVIMSEEGALYLNAGATAHDSPTATTADQAAGLRRKKTLTAKDDKDAVEQAKKLVSLMPQNNLSPVPEFEYAESGKKAEGSASDIAVAIADEGSVTELYADFGKASFTALATIGGATAGIVATNKTTDKLTSDDTAKLARFVRLCDAFSVPVVTIVDTEGFESGAEAVRNTAKAASAYAEATTVKISLVTGKAYGSAFVALAGNNANADMTFAYPDAVIAPMNPIAAAEFLYHDELKGASDVKAKREEIAKRYADEKASAFDAAAKGAVDEIIEPANVRAKIISVLDISAGKRMVKQLPKKHNVN